MEAFGGDIETTLAGGFGFVIEEHLAPEVEAIQVLARSTGLLVSSENITPVSRVNQVDVWRQSG